MQLIYVKLVLLSLLDDDSSPSSSSPVSSIVILNPLRYSTTFTMSSPSNKSTPATLIELGRE